MYEISYGPKYDKNLSTKQIAAKFRLDVKAGIEAGELPKGLKLSVRYESFSGGSAIRVKIKEVPFRVRNPERVIHDIGNPHEFVPEFHLPSWTPEAKALKDQLEAMLAAYNYDGSEIQVDYFNVKFYGGVDWAWELESGERKEIEAEYAERGPAPPIEGGEIVNFPMRAQG